jgi:hypothetical protein
MRHELLPLAHRLRREGHDVQAMVWRSRYENAWGGSIEKIARHSDGTLNQEILTPLVEEAARGDLVVVTTVKRIAELFHAAPKLFAVAEKLTEVEPSDRLLLGGWYDGEQVQAPHLLVADWGLWPGGLGPAVVQGALQAATDRMKSASFRGLFHFDVEEQPASGELRLRGLSAGWPGLHTQAFLAETLSFSKALLGGFPVLKRKFVQVLPVTIAPWPNEKRSVELPAEEIKGLTIQQQGQIFWLDVRIDQEARKIFSAGLDGLLCIATGCSDSTPALARARALELAHRISIPGKQFRPDAGMLVDSVLSTLEDRYGFVV